MAAGPDVRPGGRIKEEDEVRFAVAARAAAGWRYAVVTGWHRQVMTTLESMTVARYSRPSPVAI
ncbi:hypothetical protein [Streptomyces europaeiscabiei]|uniref:hypothetical protein n=1 Tax=Streptomyces europaeiscabiei TaxID=146819 RepID=UPI0038F6CA65